MFSVNTRTHLSKECFALEDILALVRSTDLSNPNTFLVLNGGTGVGKTSAVMRQVKQELDQQFEHPQSILVVESRTAMVDQLYTNYSDAIHPLNGVSICQRLAFMNMINRGPINYNWVVIDECHGLFSEASFAADAERIARWIKTERRNTHIIFITANDEYFDALSKKYFPESYDFIYLFPDFTQYVSNTYVKQIQFIKTNKTEAAIDTMRPRFHTQKGIIFLKRASDVKDWFFNLLHTGVRVGMMVSKANETEAHLTTLQTKAAKDAMLNISDGELGLTMADLCQMYDEVRAQAGKEPIREAINHERLPEDIDVLLATDTLQEGISIKTPIDYIVIDGFTEVEVRQKLGRFRGNLNLLYIIFNPNVAQRQINDKLVIFNKLRELENANNQTALAEFYGRQQASKSTISFLIKTTDPKTGISFYALNEPARLNVLREFQTYTRLMSDTTAAVNEMYTYPLLEGSPQILDYQTDIRNFNLNQKIIELARKWTNIPLKGSAQDELVRDFQDAEITTPERHPINTFQKCLNAFKKAGISISEKQASKKDLTDWPQLLTRPREKFKIILSS